MNSEIDRAAVGRIARVAKQERIVDDLSREGVQQLLFVHDGYLINLRIFDSNLNILEVAETLSFERLPIN